MSDVLAQRVRAVCKLLDVSPEPYLKQTRQQQRAFVENTAAKLVTALMPREAVFERLDKLGAESEIPQTDSFDTAISNYQKANQSR